LNAWPVADAISAQRVGLEVTGPGGGQWQLALRDGRIAGIELGLPGPPEFHLSAGTFGSLVSGRLSIDESINSGRLIVTARGSLDQLKGALAQLVARTSSGQSADTHAKVMS